MNEIIIAILSFLGGLFTCKIITKINKQSNSSLNFFSNNNKTNLSNENDKQNS
ncbi:hypothetical protein AMRN_0741 [Malaciobacter marinus]|uniref:Uncharacterized protein n=1 Tax=Malaciobacter marinus TaxID=505249 RepID=A0A347TIR8_9BACT|nr:hypothetical protein [Malaciobacter marinus]AXX86496.1 hypothetical protein AMRN_0741 [Malaciobacter marinus]